MCWDVLRKEFQLVQFRLLYPNAEDFAQSPWFGVVFVLMYRFVVAAFCTGWMISTLIHKNWFLWLSNWSFLVVTVYFICATIVTAIHYTRERKQTGNRTSEEMKYGQASKAKCDEAEDSDGNVNNICESNHIIATNYACNNDDETPSTPGASEASRALPMAWFHEALWVIYNIAAVAAIMVTLSFWLLLFNARNGVRALTVIFHGVNSIVMIGDTMLSSIPVRLFHVIYSMLYCIVYIMFTVIYWGAGGSNYIYPQTDYTGRPVLAAVSQLCLFFIGLPLCQTIMFCFYRLRVLIKTKRGK